jgi:hypothetical protein
LIRPAIFQDIFMAKQNFGKIGGRTRQTTRPGGAATQTVDEAVRALRAETPAPGYRESSLALHGLLCARCGREFTRANQHLLTVHHKDNNSANNPPDGSNWENLCVYCHDMEHSRELLGDYEDGRGNAVDNTRLVHTAGPAEGRGLGSLGDLLAKRKKSDK